MTLRAIGPWHDVTFTGTSAQVTAFAKKLRAQQQSLIQSQLQTTAARARYTQGYHLNITITP